MYNTFLGDTKLTNIMSLGIVFFLHRAYCIKKLQTNKRFIRLTVSIFHNVCAVKCL